MPYLFATEKRDYADYASGRVFYSQPGHTAFPIRLASEIFQRCMAIRKRDGLTGPCVLYDPCCGGGYHLSTLAYFHWAAIDQIVASDIDEKALSVANSNLSLLTLAGLDTRIAEITEMLGAYGKESHAESLDSARRLRQQLLRFVTRHEIGTRVFLADATNRDAVCSQLGHKRIDIVLSDVPYGQCSGWQASGTSSPLWQMLDSLLGVLSEGAVIAVASDKGQRAMHEAYKQVKRFRVGKRQVALLRSKSDGRHGDGFRKRVRPHRVDCERPCHPG